MKRNVFALRLAPALIIEVDRQAAKRGLTRTAWLTHLIERGLLDERVERSLEALERATDAGIASGRRPGGEGATLPGWERLVFLGCFATAMLKELNAALTRSPVEIGRIAAAARAQAEAETAALLKGGT